MKPITGEEDLKPKVEGKKKNPGRWRTNRPGGSVQREVYKAPTSGLENDVFTVGTAQDAANFEEAG